MRTAARGSHATAPGCAPRLLCRLSDGAGHRAVVYDQRLALHEPTAAACWGLGPAGVPPPSPAYAATVGGASRMVPSVGRVEAATARARAGDERPPTTRSVLLLARLLFQSAASVGGRASGAPSGHLERGTK